jgi:signal transduction histidine kinase
LRSALVARRRRLRLRDRLSLRAQLVAITALLATAVAVGLVIVVQIALAGAANRETERVLGDRSAALVTSIRKTSEDGEIHVPRAQLDPGVAVYDQDGAQVAGSVPQSMIDEFGSLSRATSRKVIEGGEHFAIMAQPFTTQAGTRGVVVITEPLGPYERNEEAALVVSLVAGALLVLMAAGSAAWISKRVLSPVDDMARTADEWSEHDLERRFDLGPPTNEIRALGNTFDGLLDKVAGVIRAEQRLTSELAHELRTPLTTINGAVDLLAMRTDLDEQAQEDLALIKNAVVSMSHTITVLLDVARRDSRASALDRTVLADLGADLEALPGDGARLVVDLPAGLFVRVPRALAVRAIAPVIANAASLSSHVRVRARLRGHAVDVLVADDGSGVPDGWAESLFEPGWSGSGGSGLGLSLARRVARSGGGDVTLVEAHNSDGGATFAITFPGGAMPPG